MKDMDAYERLSCAAETAVLVEATRSSYSRAAKILGKDAEISKTAVMDKVHVVQAELPFEKPEKKKCVEYLYIEADEDHIHKQGKTVSGKKSGRIGKLLYLYTESKENHRLFCCIQKYIETKYLKKVYISGDCGAC